MIRRPPRSTLFPTRRSSDLDEVSLKSLKTLDSRLVMLAQHAEFHVNINSVLGAGVRDPRDAIAVTARANELGLDRKSTRLNSSHLVISYAVFCLKEQRVPVC